MTAKSRCVSDPSITSIEVPTALRAWVRHVRGVEGLLCGRNQLIVARIRASAPDPLLPVVLTHRMAAMQRLLPVDPNRRIHGVGHVPVTEASGRLLLQRPVCGVLLTLTR
jgi:hypothetical protein